MLKRWFNLAVRKDTVLRSSKVALIVGTLLTVINNGEHLLGALTGEGIQSVILLKIMLTYCVPYGVSTYASVSAQLGNQQES